MGIELSFLCSSPLTYYLQVLNDLAGKLFHINSVIYLHVLICHTLMSEALAKAG